MQSEKIDELAKALAEVQAGMENAPKDGRGNYGRYPTLDNVTSVARAMLSARGLSFVQTTRVEGGETILTTVLMHASGQWISGEYPVAPQQKTPQGMGSAMTYARRYTLAAMIGLAADEDDDGEAGSRGGKPSASKAPASKAPVARQQADGQKAPASNGNGKAAPTGWDSSWSKASDYQAANKFCQTNGHSETWKALFAEHKASEPGNAPAFLAALAEAVK